MWSVSPVLCGFSLRLSMSEFELKSDDKGISAHSNTASLGSTFLENPTTRCAVGRGKGWSFPIWWAVCG